MPDRSTKLGATRFEVAPWPYGPDGNLGLFVVVAVQVGEGNTDVRVSADDNLKPGETAEVVRALHALIRQYEAAG